METEIHDGVFLVVTESCFWLEHRRLNIKTPEQPICELKEAQHLLDRVYGLGGTSFRLTDKDIIIP